MHLMAVPSSRTTRFFVCSIFGIRLTASCMMSFTARMTGGGYVYLTNQQLEGSLMIAAASHYIPIRGNRRFARKVVAYRHARLNNLTLVRLPQSRSCCSKSNCVPGRTANASLRIEENLCLVQACMFGLPSGLLGSSQTSQSRRTEDSATDNSSRVILAPVGLDKDCKYHDAGRRYSYIQTLAITTVTPRCGCEAARELIAHTGCAQMGCANPASCLVGDIRACDCSPYIVISRQQQAWIVRPYRRRRPLHASLS